MKLKIIGTGSKGNCYFLESETETLIIEAGVKITDIKKALNFDLSKVVGCIVTHEHMDHSTAISDLIKCGIDMYASAGTLHSRFVFSLPRAKAVKSKEVFKVGSFKIMAFDVKHDADEPLGFLIEHPECGKVLFLTDTFYCPYTFSGLTNIIIEANYSKEIIDRKFGSESGLEFLRNRILKSHFSLANCKEMLAANDLSKVNNILLIHLSDSNSDEIQFQKEVAESTGKNVTVATNGLEISFDKTPF